MIKYETIENELTDLENELTDLLMRITELKNEVSQTINQDKKLSQIRKPVYVQHITLLNEYTQFYELKTKQERNTIIDICNGFKYAYSGLCKKIQLSVGTRKIIETYIPSQNLVLVVEL